MNNIYEQFNASLSSLKDAEEKLKIEKADILIRTIEKLKGSERIVEQLKEKGLPECIFYGAKVNKNVVNSLCFFCTVIPNKMLNEEDVLFSWGNSIPDEKHSYYLNFFDNQ